MTRAFPKVAEIQARVATAWGVTVDDLKGRSRLRHVTTARQVAMYLANNLTVRGPADIGRRFCRDHSTVIYNVRVIASRRQRDRELDQAIRAVTAEVVA